MGLSDKEVRRLIARAEAQDFKKRNPAAYRHAMWQALLSNLLPLLKIVGAFVGAGLILYLLVRLNSDPAQSAANERDRERADTQGRIDEAMIDSCVMRGNTRAVCKDQLEVIKRGSR